MKRSRSILVLVLVLVLVATVALGTYILAQNETPHGAFERHFGSDISGSVTQIAVSGYTALAGSNEVLTFNISDEDLDSILAQRGFTDVTESVRNKKNTGIRYAEWSLNIDRAATFGISGSHFYETTKFDGLIYYIVIADEKTNRVYYHYFQT